MYSSLSLYCFRSLLLLSCFYSWCSSSLSLSHDTCIPATSGSADIDTPHCSNRALHVGLLPLFADLTCCRLDEFQVASAIPVGDGFVVFAYLPAPCRDIMLHKVCPKILPGQLTLLQQIGGGCQVAR